MNNLCTDIGFKSVNKKGEQLCGDHMEIVEQGENSFVMVYKNAFPCEIL